MTQHSCQTIQGFFSAYLDGDVSGQKMQQIANHLKTCPECSQEFDSLKTLQQSLAMLRPVKAPADLSRKLRIAISHELANKRFSWFENLGTRWDNAIRPMLVQVSAGFAGTVVLVGSVLLLLGMVAVPEPVMANDEPLGGLTAPHYLYSADQPQPIVTGRDSTIVVEAFVNDSGRVYDYNIVSGPTDSAVKTQIANQLLLSVFEPATVFGGPVRGRVVLTYSGISVRG
jgi:Putative zinc-finger